MKSILKYSIISILALLLLGIGLWFALAPKAKAVPSHGANRLELILLDDVTHNEKLLQASDVYLELQSLGIIPRTDSLWTEQEPHQIKSQLEGNTLYQSVAVFHDRTRQTMVIELRQREPLFIVHPSEAKQEPYVVCTDRHIAPLPAQHSAYLPLVSGVLSQQYASSTLYELMKVIEEQDLWRHYFDHVYVHPEHGVILSPRLYHTTIYIGKDGDWAGRLHKLKVFEEQVLSKQGMEAYSELKLQFGDQVVATKRNQQDINIPQQQDNEA